MHMADKKMFATRIDNELLKRLKHLAVDEECSIRELMEKAVEDLLNKYQPGSKKEK